MSESSGTRRAKEGKSEVEDATTTRFWPNDAQAPLYATLHVKRRLLHAQQHPDLVLLPPQQAIPPLVAVRRIRNRVPHVCVRLADPSECICVDRGSDVRREKRESRGRDGVDGREESREGLLGGKDCGWAGRRKRREECL